MNNRSRLWLLSAAVLLIALIAIPRWGFGRTQRSAGTAVQAHDDGAQQRHVAPSSRVAHAAVTPTAAAAADQATESEEQLRKRVREVVASISELARAHLYEGEAGQEYRRCTPLESERCQELFSAAMYEVLAWHVEPPVIDGKLGAAEVESMDPELVHSEAAKLLEQSTDPIERVSMLVLLTRSTRLEPVALPRAVYRDLSRKPVVESNLLLARSVHTGLPDEDTVEEVAFLASATRVDPRVQGMALAALAKPDTADSLNAAVRALGEAHDGDWSGWQADVALALGLCGTACADASVDVVAGASDGERLAVSILRLARPHDRNDLLTRLAPALSPTALAQIKQEMDI